jgi:8-oxo-dGTP diphosphatase
MADERFFAVRTADCGISSDQWTALEREVMIAHRWWSPDELAQTSETIYPDDLLELVRAALFSGDPGAKCDPRSA